MAGLVGSCVPVATGGAVICVRSSFLSGFAYEPSLGTEHHESALRGHSPVELAAWQSPAGCRRYLVQFFSSCTISSGGGVSAFAIPTVASKIKITIRIISRIFMLALLRPHVIRRDG